MVVKKLNFKRLTNWNRSATIKNCDSAELAELVDALDSDSSVRKDFRVQVPGSALSSAATGKSKVSRGE